MSYFEFPYGKEQIVTNISDEDIAGIVKSKLHSFIPEFSEEELIERALQNPVASKPLSELSKGKREVVIIASDHTRPVPSKLIIPPMLREIRKGNPSAQITILIATGCHRGTTKAELLEKFGDEIFNSEKIIVHDCDASETLVKIGTLPSGGECIINRIAYEADLLVSEGFIEPHFFAGFSGGRKSVLPGIASRETVLANHCSEFIESSYARTGVLENNPIHKDMLWAAKKAKLSYIVNVVLNENKKVIYAVSGDAEAAHLSGCGFLLDKCAVPKISADVVISTNGGYPLDQNVYQAVKGMTAAEACVNQGGVIIMIAKSGDGVGGDDFYHQLSSESDIDKTLEIFKSRKRSETVPDQWQSQIMLRVLKKATVMYLSDCADALIHSMHMIPIHSVEEGIARAKKLLCNEKAKIAVIPDGISVIIKD